jgi:hypothetical protein
LETKSTANEGILKFSEGAMKFKESMMESLRKQNGDLKEQLIKAK